MLPSNCFVQLKHSVSAVSASVAPLQDKKSLVVLPPHNIKNIIIAISSAFHMLSVVSKKLSFEPMPFSGKVEILPPLNESSTYFSRCFARPFGGVSYL